MATYIQIHELRQNGHFLHQTAVALSKAFTDIRNEIAPTTNHANRLTLAYKDPDVIAKAISWDILANATMQGYAPNAESVPDGDMQFVVNSLLADAELVARLNAVN